LAFRISYLLFDWIIAERITVAVLIKLRDCFSVRPSTFRFSSLWMYLASALAAFFPYKTLLSNVFAVNIRRLISICQTPA